ncbi:MAG: aldo/keto reductase, partial [Firmicutes bacterium]|nr:aldo/keto reductase [Bacillota bacterium]
MYYSDFKGLKLSKLGFGTMRLPLMEDGKTIDSAQTEEMVKYALDHGVNYFDTAYP